MKFIVLSKNITKNKIYYHVKDEFGNKYFAKKLESIEDEKKFAHEIDMAQLFSDSNIGPKIKYISPKDRVILYEYIEGQTLQGRIVDFKTSIEIIIDICNLLEIIHNKGYIFGDLKPSNIMINDKLLLIDYECVTAIGEILDYASKLYCSPYQIKDRKAIYQFDFYSLGIIFLELLIGNDKIKELFNDNLLTNIKPEEIILNIPISISFIIKKLLSKNVDDNYKNISEIKNDLLKIKE